MRHFHCSVSLLSLFLYKVLTTYSEHIQNFSKCVNGERVQVFANVQGNPKVTSFGRGNVKGNF